MTLVESRSTAYGRTEFDANFPEGIEQHYWFKARNGALHRALRHASRRGWLPAAPTMLEVGCGTGIVLADLRARGHRISGVELGTPPRVLAPLHMTTGTSAVDLPLAVRDTIDALLFLDVVEHVPDDVRLLRETLAAFPRCRTVILTVPARPELWSEHDRHYGHFRRYTRTSLNRSLVDAGLEPRSTRYMFRSLFAAAALIKGIGGDRDPIMRAPKGRLLHPILARILATEDRLLSSLPLPGLSLLAIATRPI